MAGSFKCSKCLQALPASSFYSNKATKTGLTVYCKICSLSEQQKYYPTKRLNERKKYAVNPAKSLLKNKKWRKDNPEKLALLFRARNLKKYKLSLADYESICVKQGHVCSICKKPELTKKKFLAVDHDHNTGKIRGLLCLKCNTGLGHFKDSADLLVLAAEYLFNSSQPILKLVS